MTSQPDAIPYLETGNRQVDRAFRIAIGDLYGNIRSFQDGLLEQPELCILAGLDYDTPWTRDAAINVWNGAGLLVPRVARNTLRSVLERRAGELFIGGQYWDAIIWATGAWSYYLQTGDRDLLEEALEATTNSLRHFEETEFDARNGLFRGGSLFNDGVAGYPDLYARTAGHSSGILQWPAANPDWRSEPGYGLPMQALSTNCLYYMAYQVAGRMAAELGQSADSSWSTKADALKAAINRHFWDASAERYRYLVDPFGGCDRQEGAGWALAILAGVADEAQREALFRNVHRTPAGIPCVWPTYERYLGPHGADVGRHAGTVWPFIQAFWVEACARHGRLDAFADELLTLAACACRDLQFAEIYHPETTERYGGLQENNSPEPELWHSCDRQTWSATGYIRMILLSLIGLQFEPDGLRVRPAVPAIFQQIRLGCLHYRDAELEILIKGHGAASSATLNGQPTDDLWISADTTGRQEIVITLGQA
jgi:glycogen debranching enzyme